MNSSSTHSPLLARSINDLGYGAGIGPGPGSTPFGHPDLHDIVQTHAHFHSFMPFEEKAKLLAMHQASQSNAGSSAPRCADVCLVDVFMQSGES